MTELREKVARAIAPNAWQRFDEAKASQITTQMLEDAREPCARSLTKADDILNLIGGDGWKLVPVEPTREMLRAAGIYDDRCAIENYGGRADHEGIWDAMIAASPPPPVSS